MTKKELITKYGQAWYDKQKTLNAKKAKLRYYEHPESRQTPEQAKKYNLKYLSDPEKLEKKRARMREYFRNKYGCKALPKPDKNGFVPCQKCGKPRKLGGPKCVSCRLANEQEYRDRHREKFRNRLKAWKAANPDRKREQDVTHTANRRARIRGNVGSHTLQEWKEILKAYKNKCAYCGSRDNLEKDHITPLVKGGCNYAFNLQPLCKSCNCRKNARILHPISLFDRPTLAEL